MRFRFSIRDLLWLTALVAAVVAWMVDRANYAKRTEHIRDSLWAERVDHFQAIGELQNERQKMAEERATRQAAELWDKAYSPAKP
jgi:hypothetical protein